MCRQRSGRLHPTRRRFENSNGRATQGDIVLSGRPGESSRLRRVTGVRMTAPQDALIRENAYLRQRVAQLQDDVTALAAEAERLRQALERLHGRNPQRPPNPLSGGQ